MANTYTLIASNTLTTTAVSVTFSSIPGTYTDLVLKYSTRATTTGSTYQNGKLTFNGSTASNYSRTQIRGDGSTATSARDAGAEISLQFDSTAADATANTFNNNEIYIPSYTVSQNKPISASIAHETNSTTAYTNAVAGLWRVTNAITSITLAPAGDNFASGSSFFLYGIKNS